MRSMILVGVVAVVSVVSLEAQEPAPPDRDSPEPGDTTGVLLLDTLSVVGSRASGALPLRTRSVEILDRARIEALPAQSVADLLAYATGVELMSRSPAQADLSIRGAGFEQVLVLVDGVRMNDPQTGHFALNLPVPLDEVERVEVLRGPASTQYGGDAVGGVVNVVTRSGGGDAASGKVEGGSFSTFRASATGAHAGEGLRVRGGAEWTRSDGHREGTEYEMLHATAALEGEVGPGTARVRAGFGSREFGAADFYAPFPSWEEIRARNAVASWVGRLSSSVELESSLSVRSHDDNFVVDREDPSFGQNVHTSSQVGGEVVVRGILAGPFRMAAGAEAYRDRLESTNLGDREQDRAALFGEAAWDGDGPAAASAGLRVDRHDTFGTFLSPSFSASYDLAPGARLRGSAGRSFRGGSFTERFYTDPVHQARSDLKPERSWAYEVGADLDGPGGLTFRPTVFHRNSQDLIDWALPVGVEVGEAPWQTRNVESARFRGLEVQVAGPEVLGFGWSASSSLLSVRAREEGEYHSKQLLRPMTEQLLVSLDRRVLDQGVLAVQTRRERRKGESGRTILDLTAALELPTGRFHLELLNATDLEYVDVAGAPAPGRRLLAGYSVGW